MKPNRTVQTFLICLLSVLICDTVSAQSRDRTIAQFAHTAWGTKEGAPGYILAITQSRDGYLWLGSKDGLVRFDGVAFEHYKPESGPEIPGTQVRSLLALPNGDLWVGYSSGVISLLSDGRAETYTKRDGLPGGVVTSLAQDSEGTIWAGTSNGLARLDAGRWAQVGKEWNFQGKSVWTLHLDRKGTLWVTTDDVMVFLPTETRTFQSTSIHLTHTPCIVEAPNGRLWMSETAIGIRPIPFGDNVPPSYSGVIKMGSQGILFDQGGALWITTVGDGLVRVPDPDRLKGEQNRSSTELESFTAKMGLTDNVATTTFQDREGNIWVGTITGLDRFRASNVVPIVSPIERLDADILPANNGDIWAKSNEGLARIHESIIYPVKYPAGQIIAMYYDFTGIDWWLSIDGLVRFENGHFTRLPLPKEVANPFMHFVNITGDGSGGLWAFMEGKGFFHWSHDAWSSFKTPPDLATLRPTTAFKDDLGSIWVGFVGGTILSLHGDKLETVAEAKQAPVGDVREIQGRNGEVWVGGTRGVAFLDKDQFRIMVPNDADTFKGVSGLEETADGSLWLRALNGIIHIDTGELHRFIETPAYRVRYEIFDSLDGLPGALNDVIGNPETQDTNGRLWINASNGIAWLDPRKIVQNPQPLASVRHLDVDGTQYKAKMHLILPAGTTNLRIVYGALSLSMPERVRYRYELEGTDKGWQNGETRREAFYTNLGPGKHRFQVSARNERGDWSATSAVLEFAIEPEWYQTNWFHLLSAFAVLLVAWMIYRLRVRQIAKAMSARFDERLHERTRLARDLHDTFLQTIQGSKLVADDALDPSTDPARMRPAMEQLSAWLGRATEEGRAALNSLRTSTTEQNDLAAAFRRAMEECRIHASMKASLSVVGETREMHPIVRDEVYCIGYEAIRNACVHSQASQLQVELNYDHDLALRITDNGVGIDPAIADHGKEGHFGMQGMRERAVRIVGKLTVVSSAASGTEIRLLVPGAIIYRKTTFAPQSFPAKIKSLFSRRGLTSNPTDSNR